MKYEIKYVKYEIYIIVSVYFNEKKKLMNNKICQNDEFDTLFKFYDVSCHVSCLECLQVIILLCKTSKINLKFLLKSPLYQS